MAWHKAQCGAAIEWIGINFAAGPDYVEMTVGPDRIRDILRDIDSALRAKGILCKDLRPLAGVLSWIAGVVFRIRPWVSCLWAAIRDQSP